MIVRQVKVGPMENFVYVLAEERSRDALVVDSGWETRPVVEAASSAGANVKYVVATHGHFDHTSTLDELAELTGASVVAHEDSQVKCDERVREGSELKLGGKVVSVMHTPGHTHDSICLYTPGMVFTGDMLFVDSIGKFEPSEVDTMFGSLWERIMKLPPATVMYPGHDYGAVPSRTLAAEAASNPYLAARDLRSFRAFFS